MGKITAWSGVIAHFLLDFLLNPLLNPPLRPPALMVCCSAVLLVKSPISDPGKGYTRRNRKCPQSPGGGGTELKSSSLPLNHQLQ